MAPTKTYDLPPETQLKGAHPGAGEVAIHSHDGTYETSDETEHYVLEQVFGYQPTHVEESAPTTTVRVAKDPATGNWRWTAYGEDGEQIAASDRGWTRKQTAVSRAKAFHPDAMLEVEDAPDDETPPEDQTPDEDEPQVPVPEED